jgi:hypothetical protein
VLTELDSVLAILCTLYVFSIYLQNASRLGIISLENKLSAERFSNFTDLSEEAI